MSPAPLSLLALLLIAAPLFPALVSGAWLFRALRPPSVAVAPWAALPALAVALIHLQAPSAFPAVELTGFFTGLRLALDPVGGALLLLTALLWVAAGAFAAHYHAEDPGRDRFFGFFSLTMAGNVGLVLAGELISFYLCFAVMTFAAYGLVVHRGDAEALKAGRIYIVLALIGEMALLSGILILAAEADGDTTFGLALEGAWNGLAASAPLVAALVLAGFGVKAGLVPLHLWLPLAHPVAPTAASALLSGAMIKAGLLGWLRVLPETLALPGLGGALILGGTVTAFYGVAVGMVQRDPKTILAYSSVSQMGYMAIGTGVLLFTPDPAPFAVAAVVLYALHHGVAKGSLFLSVGVADRVHWAGSRMGLLFLVGTALPALALAGAPLTSGARAKTALSGPLAGLGGPWYQVLDPLLVLAAIGTALLMARFLVALRKRRGDAISVGGPEEEAGGRAANGLLVPWLALVVAGATAPFWVGAVLPLPPDGRMPPLLYGAVRSTLPVAVGIGIAWAVLARPGLLRGADRIRIPPGDLAVLAEYLVARLGLRLKAPLLRRTWRHATAPAGLGSRTMALLGELTARDLSFARGGALGFFLLCITALLALSVLRSF